ncbi:ribulose-phosphate 3-epimerase [Pectinatus haikarae]|uniref:ribulose-phosphate 3-epimerase n=1 Tax=Pectinatus haikarae TaxID=349096 RepID=UPI0018C5195E|nr:ribulose-phosphate 3-epimerase [Pectinatus haikarae]
MENHITISPSLICADLCNLKSEVSLLKKAGMQSLHVDIIDPHFSPSMPIGLSTIEQLHHKSLMDFDIHIMSTMNEFFINELLKINPASITFHYETTLHVEKMLQIIKNAGIKTGIALNPATPIDTLKYVIKECDYLLLMLINPGYADGKSEEMITYATDKIRDCKNFIKEHGASTKIIVDGRVSMDVIPALIDAGAEVLVAGSKSIFRKDNTYAENYRQAVELINKHLKDGN